MHPILYTSITEGTVPSHYGVGVLNDCLKCEVKEQRNGAYELELEYPSEGLHASAIVPNAVIKAKPNYTDLPQLFRIYKVSKSINGRFQASAQHIVYDLSGKVITSGTAASCTAACLLLTGQAGNFNITTDKTVSAAFKITEPSSVRSWFGGKTGSILDVYGPGEWAYNNFSAEFKAARGQDRGVTIRYGKNLTELSQTLDMSNLVSAIVPYYKAQDGTVTAGAAVSTGLVGVQNERAVDFTSNVDPESAVPIVTQLATAAASYIANNNFTILKNNITLDFVQIKELTERVDLCDTVHIYFEPLGITATAKCIETTWDVLNERYMETVFGDPKTNIADTLLNTQKEVQDKPSVTAMEQAINEATELITGNLGGYVVLHDSNGDGKPDEILIMDDEDISQAVNVWRWNQGGLGFSPNGYAGPYDPVAIDMLGRISATSITTGTLNANLIKAGIISDVQGNSTIDMTNGEAKMKNFKAISELDLIDASNNVRASIKYSSAGEASFYVYNSSGTATGVLQCHPTQGAMLALKDLNGTNDSIKAGGNGIGGGWLETRNYDNERTFLVDNTANGNCVVEIWDPNENNEAQLRLIDHAGNHDVIAQVTAYGGRVDVNNGGYIYGSLRVYNSGGVLDLYDAQYLNIQCLGRTGNITCVSLTQTSSRKVKENIKPMEDFRKILDLEAVSFDFKNKNRGTNKRGFIAEDVEKVLPNLVTPETETLPASLDYLGMIPYLQAVIKDQEKRITALEKIIKEKGATNGNN